MGKQSLIEELMVWDGIKRRKIDMPNGFDPKSAFEGYVVGKLEAISDRLAALPCKTQDERIRDAEQKISKIEGKAAILGTLGGIITYLFGKLLGK